MRKGPIRDSSHGRTLAKGMHQIGRPVAHGTREEVSGTGRSARSQVRTSVISRLPRIDPLPICGTLWQWFSSGTSLAQVDPRVQHALKVLALRKSRLATVFHLKDFPHLFLPDLPVIPRLPPSSVRFPRRQPFLLLVERCARPCEKGEVGPHGVRAGILRTFSRRTLGIPLSNARCLRSDSQTPNPTNSLARGSSDNYLSSRSTGYGR